MKRLKTEVDHVSDDSYERAFTKDVIANDGIQHISNEIIESYPLENEFQPKYKVRINNSVTSLGTWNSCVVSGSFASMRFWKCTSAGLEEQPINFWQKRTTQKHTSFVFYIASWGDLLLTASSNEDESKIIVWNTAGSRELLFLNHFIHSKGSNICLYQGSLCCTNNKSQISVWKRNGRCVGTVSKHNHSITYLLSVKNTLWSIDQKGITYLWNENGECQSELSFEEVTAVCVWNGRAVLAYKKQIQILDETGTTSQELSVEENMIQVMHSCNLFLFCGTESGHLLAFDHQLKLLKKWKGHEQAVRAVCVWQGQLWTGGDDYTIRTWKIPVWKMVRTLFVALMKNSAEDCPLAGLPRDVFRYLLQIYLHGIYVS